MSDIQYSKHSLYRYGRYVGTSVQSVRRYSQGSMYGHHSLYGRHGRYNRYVGTVRAASTVNTVYGRHSRYNRFVGTVRVACTATTVCTAGTVGTIE